MFDINLGLTIWTTFVFLALLGILWKFAWGPVLRAVEAREARIQGALDQAASEREAAERLLAEHRVQMADARRQAQQLVAEGREAGDRLRQEIEERARTEGRVLIERARETIEREREAAVETLRRESVELALAAAARLMRERLDEAADRELVIGYLDEVAGPDGDIQA